MRKIVKITVILAVFFGLLLFGVSRYNLNKQPKKKHTYITSVKTGGATLIMGGMAGDKEKIKSFEEDFKREGAFNKYWEQVDLSNEYRRQKDYEKAIFHREKALEFAAQAIARSRAGSEGQAGMKAFLERQKPPWIEKNNGK